MDSNGQSLLDVGCGDGRMIKALLKDKKYFSVGADIYLPSLRTCRIQKIHDGYVLSDAQNMPFKNRSFDIVLAVEIVEHLEKEEGKKAIQAWEEIARREVIITTPVGVCPVAAKDGSPYDVHKSAWYPSEFRILGYKVRGHGIRQMYGDSGFFNRAPKIMIPAFYILSVLVGPFVYFLPELSGRMVCIKRIIK
jgi:SAM-dependent methyltransferase